MFLSVRFMSGYVVNGNLSCVEQGKYRQILANWGKMGISNTGMGID